MVADFGLMTVTDLSTVFLSETVVSSGGTLCWMSPELLDPQRFGSNGRPTCESDRYAVGMVIYEVSWLRMSRRPLKYSFTLLGSNRSPTLPSPLRICACARCTEG